MEKTRSLSLKQFNTAVQSAVAAAKKKHPKFKLDVPQGISFSYIIRGIPFDAKALADASVSETQAFANEIAKTLAATPELANLGIAADGCIYSRYPHLILGIPAPDPWTVIEE